MAVARVARHVFAVEHREKLVRAAFEKGIPFALIEFLQTKNVRVKSDRFLDVANLDGDVIAAVYFHCSPTIMPESDNSSRCVIVGGGPAGMMTGYLLARAGVNVVVLEKHADFNRDFRGDTIHPSTLELMGELGLLDEFLRLPHQEVPQLAGQVGTDRFPVADFRHL